MVQYVAFGQQVNKDKSKERKQSLLLSYALLKPPISWTKESSLQTEPWAGVLAQRDWQEGTSARAGHDGPAWETEAAGISRLGEDMESEQALMWFTMHQAPTSTQNASVRCENASLIAGLQWPGTGTVAVLLLITLSARKHSLAMNSLIHPILAFPVHPLLGQQQ